MIKGSLKLRPAAIVRTGSKQQNKAPNRIIFPMCGSTGNRAKWTPRGVNCSCLSNAFYQWEEERDRINEKTYNTKEESMDNGFNKEEGAAKLGL